jgi:hypothetical protein
MANTFDEERRRAAEQDAAARTGLREDRRSQLQDFEDRMTSDPEDTVVGPAAAAASSMVREYLLNKEDDSAGTFDPTGGMGMAAGTIKNVAKPMSGPAIDAGRAALRQMARPVTKVPTKTALDTVKEASKSSELGINKLRAGIKAKKTSEIDATLKRNVSVPVDHLPIEEKRKLVEHILLKNNDEAYNILKKNSKNLEGVKAKEAKMPKSEDIYGKKGLYKG